MALVASEEMQTYFRNLEDKAEDCYKLVSKARKAGFDPSDDSEIPRAKDLAERVEALSRLIGVEKSIYFQVDGHDKVFPICNEDLERETDVKTSAVHFMRFEFDQNMIADFVSGSDVKVGSAHPNYDYETSLDSQSQEALSEDFNS